jgi:hypothetical protein
MDIHGAYFVTAGTLNLMRQILRGIDRDVLDKLGITKGAAWPLGIQPQDHPTG